MEKSRFLLTYTDGSMNEDTYAWFDSESELKQFVREQYETAPFFCVYEAQEVIQTRRIEL